MNQLSKSLLGFAAVVELGAGSGVVTSPGDLDSSVGGTSVVAGGTSGTSVGGQGLGGFTHIGGNTGLGGAATGGAATGGAGQAGSPCGVQPVNPSATQATKNALCYLYQICKQKTVSGVQACGWSVISDVTYVYNTTGVYPAIVGGDFLYTDAVSQATSAWNTGSLPLVRYQMGNPMSVDEPRSHQEKRAISDALLEGSDTATDLSSEQLLELLGPE